jgi:hypothetical protein
MVTKIQTNKISTLPENDNRILASKELVGQIPDAQIDDELERLASGMIMVVADRIVDGKQLPITGVLSSVLFDNKPEIEIKMNTDDAFDVIEAQKQHFNTFELHKNERVVELKGPFLVTAARIQDIDSKTSMCVLALQLERPTKKS